MPYVIDIKCPYSTIAEDVAVKSAYDTFVTALRSASTHKVDAAGTVIGGKKQSADEAGGSHLAFGTVW